MPSTPAQVLLLSDNARLVASLEGALAAIQPDSSGGPPERDWSCPGTPLEAASRGQFRLHRLARPEQLDRDLPDLLATIDAAVVDGTAPCFSNGQLERVLLALDRHQLGAVLLTQAPNECGMRNAECGIADRARTTARGHNSAVPNSALRIPNPIASPPGPDGYRERSTLGELPLVWTLPADQLDRLPATLRVIAGYQQVVRHLQREIRLFQRLDSRITGHFNEIDEEMRLAGRIQRDFLPKLLPGVGRARFAALYRPASWVSGDLYDVFRLDERHVGFYVADAVGHGMPAALLTMFVKRAMETKQVDESGYRLLAPQQTLAALNRALLEAGLSASQFTTAVYAILDVQTLELRFARGGHPHPIWLHRDGTTSEPQADGGLLGIFPEAQFAGAAARLAPGDKFILYSDGLESAFVRGEQLVNDQYRRHLESARLLPVEHMLNVLVDQMDRQAGSLNPRDDVTVVALEIAG